MIAFWTHYTAALVIGPLLIIAALSHELCRREVLAVVASTAIGWLAVTPLMVGQLGQGHTGEGIDAMARLNVGNVVEVVGAPFDSRYGYFDLTVSAAVGALLVVTAALVVLVRPPRQSPKLRSLILPLSVVPVATVVVVTAGSTDVLLTRYVAVAVPVMLVLIAAALDAQRSRPALAALGVAVLAAASGSILAHTPRGLYQDWRGGAENISMSPEHAEAIILTHSAIRPTFEYYAARAELEGLTWVGADQPEAQALVEQKRRLWLFVNRPLEPAQLRAFLADAGYRPVSAKRFVGNDPLQLILAAPSKRRPRTRGSSSAPQAWPVSATGEQGRIEFGRDHKTVLAR